MTAQNGESESWKRFFERAAEGAREKNRTCPKCRGSGTVRDVPDDPNEMIPEPRRCPDCGGTGVAGTVFEQIEHVLGADQPPQMMGGISLTSFHDNLSKAGSSLAEMASGDVVLTVSNANWAVASPVRVTPAGVLQQRYSPGSVVVGKAVAKTECLLTADGAALVATVFAYGA